MVARRTAILESSASLRAELEELKEMEAKRRVEYKRALQNNLVQQALIGENNTSRASTKKLAGIAREGDSCNDKGEVLSETLHANGGFDALFIEFNAKLELQILNANMKANLSSLEKILNESTANTWQLEKEIKSAIEFPDKIKSVYICDLADLDVALRKESDNKAKLKESMMETINRLKEERVKLSKEANLIRKEICDILDDREFLYRSKVTTLKAVSIEESRYKFLVSEFIRVRQEIDELAFNPNPSQTADDNRGDSGYDWIDVAFEDLLGRYISLVVSILFHLSPDVSCTYNAYNIIIIEVTGLNTVVP